MGLCQAHSSASFNARVTAQHPVVHKSQSQVFLLFREWLSNLSVYWNHLELLWTSDSWASPLEILIRKLSWWVWALERAGVSGKSLRDAANPRTTLKALVPCKKGGLHQSSEKNALYTSPLKFIFKFCVCVDLFTGHRCPWSSKDGAGIHAAGVTLGTELRSSVYAHNCRAISPVLLLFLSRESMFPGIILQIPTF